MTITRHGGVVGITSNKIEAYKKLHQAVWPVVRRLIYEANIRNYSIYLRKLPDGQHYLFSYFEYIGNDFDTDMRRMADDPVTQEWWAVCKPCHVPVPDRDPGEWWARMEEVFHQD